ncbi:LysE family translocator [Spongiibacter nanhainus]|uniref:LysE family translocator n=1 Tax=Spongiibacter nanhainus TaxID=2794344 RepID=A0A7T4UQ78_9GAMM|nr:LysE family translocator [Spongiibacter nanhainus]QQD18483.1 LysE family translocator [Spongiibacter nanhainus]
MTLWDALTLFAAMTALALLPSTSVALVISRSVSGGPRHGVATSLGVVAGDLVFVALALLGMTALSAALGSVFSVVRLLAGLFLVYYGVQLWRRASSSTDDSKQSKPAPDAPWYYPGSLLGSFSAGLGLTLADIKAIVFYASLLPLFVQLNPLSYTDAALVAAITVVSVGGAKLFYVLLAGQLPRHAITARHRKTAHRTMGSGLIAAGAYLIARAD